MARIDASFPQQLDLHHRNCGQSNYIVRASASVWYQFFISAGNSDFYYCKSTNGGLTWSAAISVKGSVTGGGLAVWFDKWTPGDSGTLLHVAYFVNAVVYYRSFDTAADPATPGTEITVFTGVSATFGATTCLSITKSKGGRIYIAFDIDGGTETGFYKSDDYPVTAFTAKTDVNEATSDYYWLFPGSYADTADIECLYFDRSATALTLKTFDDSANTWSESAALSSAIANIASTTVASQISGVVRLSDGHLIVAAWTNVDTLNADLLCWDVNGSASITAKTNIRTDSTDDQGGVALCIDTTGAAETIYAFYAGKDDGTETWQTALHVYGKASTDGGATWGSETQYSTDHTRNISLLKTAPQTADGELVIFQGGVDILLSATVNLVSPAAAGGGLLTHPGMSGGMRG